MTPAKKKFFLKACVIVIVILLAVIAHKTGIFTFALLQFDRLGNFKPFAFIFSYALTCVFFVPSLIFAYAAGILFPLPLGIFFGALGNALGATAALFLGRYFLHSQAERWASKHSKFRLMTNAVAVKGWKIVTLARLTPIFPFLIANYLFGLTRISSRSYFSASFIGTIPSTTVYAYTGMLTGSLQEAASEGRERTILEWILLIGGLGIAIMLSLYLKKIALNAVNEALPDSRQTD